jgi:hypothetical protein
MVLTVRDPTVLIVCPVTGVLAYAAFRRLGRWIREWRRRTRAEVASAAYVHAGGLLAATIALAGWIWAASISPQAWQTLSANLSGRLLLRLTAGGNAPGLFWVAAVFLAVHLAEYRELRRGEKAAPPPPNPEQAS